MTAISSSKTFAVPLRAITTRPRPDFMMIALAVLVFALSSLTFEANDPGLDWPRMAVAIAVSTACGVAALFLAQAWLFRPTGSRPLTTIYLLLVLVVMIRSLTLGLTYGQGPPPSLLLYRILMNFVVVVPLLMALMWMLAYVDHHTKKVTELANEQALVSARNQQLRTATEQGSQAISALVADVALPAVRDNQLLLAEAGSGNELTKGILESVAQDIAIASDRQIRSLSHVLHEAEQPLIAIPKLQTAAEHLRSPHLEWRQVFGQAVSYSRIPVRSLAIAMPYLLVPVVWRSGVTVASTLVLLACSLAILVMLGSLNTVLSTRLESMSVTAKGVALTIALSAVGFLIALILNGGLGGTIQPFTLACIAVSTVIVGWLCAIAGGANRAIVVAEREIAAAVAQERWQTALLHHALLTVQHRAAAIVHGQVQGRFVSASVILTTAASQMRDDHASNGHQVERALHEANDVLELAVADVQRIAEETHPNTELKPEKALADIANAWASVIRVDVSISNSATSTVRRVSHQEEWLASITRELISNAVRHGKAESISIKIDATASRFLLEATDDGTGPRRKYQPGLGFLTVNELGGTVTLKPLTPGCSVRIDIPLAPELA